MHPLRMPGIEGRILPDGYVVLHSPSDDLVHTLTPQAGLVWQFCDGENSPEEISAQINTLIKATGSSTSTDQVNALLSDLSRIGLIRL